MFKFHFKKYRYLLRALAGTVVLLLFLMNTNPNRVALGFLLIPVLLLTFVTYQLVRGCFSVFYGAGSGKKQRTVSLIIAIATGVLIMLQSIGQLVAVDFAIIIFLVLVAIFYTSRFR